MALEDFPKLLDYDWHGRLMFGTDLPVWQAYEKVGLTARYREYARAFRKTWGGKAASAAEDSSSDLIRNWQRDFIAKKTLRFFRNEIDCMRTI